jgi:hypothetical protein
VADVDRLRIDDLIRPDRVSLLELIGAAASAPIRA